MKKGIRKDEIEDVGKHQIRMGPGGQKGFEFCSEHKSKPLKTFEKNPLS